MYVETVLTVNKRFSDLIATSFNKEPTLFESLDKACKSFLNNNSVTRFNKATSGSRTPELLAKHCDNLLKKGTTQEDDIDARINDVMIVFKVKKEL